MRSTRYSRGIVDELALGGRLIIPVGEGEKQRMFSYTREEEKEFSRQEHGEFAFVPMLASRAQDQ